MMRRLARFVSDIAGTPVSNRRSDLSNRKASLLTRALALGFLMGLATGIGLWIYDRFAQNAKAAEAAAS